MHKTINSNDLKIFCILAMEKAGMSRNDAEITADVLVTTDLFGIFSHGTKNLRKYIKKMQSGGINPRAVPEIIAEGGNWAILDGKAAMGMVESYKAMEIAIDKAKKTAFSYVGVKNGSHFGAAGYYANMAAKQNMIGIAMSNTDPNMSIPGGRGSILGNNPLSYAIPTGTGKIITLDIAMSSVAALKVIQAKNEGREIPDNWVVDKDGLPTKDASVYTDNGGSLQPMAGHKGYGLSLFVEILAAVLTGAGITKEVKSWNNELTSTCKAGHAFIAIDINSIIPISLFRDRIDNLVNEIHGSPKAMNSDRIFLPGEIEWEKYNDAKKNGIKLPEYVVESLKELAEDLNLDLDYEQLISELKIR